MENLTKHQIILLTLLVSFVTSIATGIVTVALMNQTPVGITQTINRVVERTIEQVTTPSPTKNTTTIKETVVVNIDDQIISAIDKNSKSILRIYKTETDPTTLIDYTVFVAIGVVVTEDGIIATDNSVILDGGKYFTKTDGGMTHDLTILRDKAGEHIALLKIKPDEKNLATVLSKVAVSTQGDLKLGQAIVYIGGETKNIVATGIVSSINTRDIKIEDTMASSTASSTPTTKTQTIVSSLQTSISTANFIEGGLLLNLSGELVGIKSTYTTSERIDLFAPVSDIKSTLSDFAETQKKTQ